MHRASNAQFTALKLRSYSSFSILSNPHPVNTPIHLLKCLISSVDFTLFSYHSYLNITPSAKDINDNLHTIYFCSSDRCSFAGLSKNLTHRIIKASCHTMIDSRTSGKRFPAAKQCLLVDRHLCPPVTQNVLSCYLNLSLYFFLC